MEQTPRTASTSRQLRPPNVHRILAAWSGERDVLAARAAVDTAITAAELEQRITKVKLR